MGRALSVFWTAVLPLAALVLLPVQPRADAYLSEDKVYYGADSYTVDYDKEIVHAKGRAFFRKGDRSVFSDRIVIYYGKQEKRALFYDNVVVKDMKSGYTVTGERAEARFSDYYRIEKFNVRDEAQRAIVRHRRRRRGPLLGRFYSDARYGVGAPPQLLKEARSSKKGQECVEALEGERRQICCDSSLDERSGDLIFQATSLFRVIREKASPNKGASLEKADRPKKRLAFRDPGREIRYLREGDAFTYRKCLPSAACPSARPRPVFEVEEFITVRRSDRREECALSQREHENRTDTKRLIFSTRRRGFRGAMNTIG
jgi:hypothetical protein